MAARSASPPLRPVFLLTDFGLDDAYVGVMKAVLRRLHPSVTIDDLCHGIEPQNVQQAAYQLFTALPYLPEEALIAVVVDPGVGTPRKIHLHRWGERIFLSPDNGLVAMAFEFLCAWGGLQSCEVSQWEIPPELLDRTGSRPAWPFGATFDGRDVFMPLAAVFASTQPPWPANWHELPLDPRRWLPEQAESGKITGEILLFDRFGNAITNIPLLHWPYPTPFREGQALHWRIQVGHGLEIPFAEAYGSGPDERPFALCNSSGLLEIALRNGSYRRYVDAHSNRIGGAVVDLLPVLHQPHVDS